MGRAFSPSPVAHFTQRAAQDGPILGTTTRDGVSEYDSRALD